MFGVVVLSSVQLISIYIVPCWLALIVKRVLLMSNFSTTVHQVELIKLFNP